MRHARVHFTLKRLALISLFGLATFSQVERAAAAVFNVNPTRLMLSAQQTSALLTLSNDSDKTIRFQLTAVSWDQTIDGQMQLAPTSDLIVYPPLVSIAAHDTRRIRVGLQSPAGAVERTYRLFVEELPDESAAPTGSRAVQVRTKMGVPVFVQSPKPSADPKIDGLTVAGGAATFDVRNAGTSFTVIHELRLKGFADGGREVFASEAKGWYLLAQHRQAYRLALDPAQCGQIKKLQLSVTTDHGDVTSTIELTPGACAVKLK